MSKKDILKSIVRLDFYNFRQIISLDNLNIVLLQI